MQVKRNKVGVTALVLVAAIAWFTALAHMSCIVLGESCYRAQLAPEEVVQSAIDGTWFASIATSIVSFLFVLCGLYALSAARLISVMPLLRWGIYTISGVCLIRGFATLPLSIMFPEKVTPFSMLAGGIWLLSGAMCLAGFLMINKGKE